MPGMPGQPPFGNNGTMPGQPGSGNNGTMPGQPPFGNNGTMPGQPGSGNNGTIPGMPGQEPENNDDDLIFDVFKNEGLFMKFKSIYLLMFISALLPL